MGQSTVPRLKWARTLMHHQDCNASDTNYIAGGSHNASADARDQGQCPPAPRPTETEHWPPLQEGDGAQRETGAVALTRCQTGYGSDANYSPAPHEGGDAQRKIAHKTTREGPESHSSEKADRVDHGFLLPS